MRSGIMLCYPFEEKRLQKWGNTFLIQPKLDGDRCRAIFDEFGKVTLLSSEENKINSVPHIVDQLEQTGYKNIELDGELYTHGANHQLIHGTVARTVNLHPEFENIDYHIFDIVTGDAQLIRSNWIDTKLIESDNVKKVETWAGEDIKDVMKALEYFTEHGYEGVILRNINLPYVRKRSTGIMKFKPRKSDYYIIVGYEEEISHVCEFCDKYYALFDEYEYIKIPQIPKHNCTKGIPKNALGALILKSDTEQIFKVGSGSFLTRENREMLWQKKESMLNQVAHVKYQHLTERRVPRFPVLVDIIGIV
jgi:ATP-dependent DNA ligase